MFAKWVIAVYAINAARAVPQVSTSTTTTPPGVSTGAPSITLVTSVASPTVPLTATLPSQVPLPPAQAWCPSEIFCPGAVCHVFFSRFDSSAYIHLVLYSSCKPSTPLSSGRTQKSLLTSPRTQAPSRSLLRLRPSTPPIPPRVLCSTS